MMLHEMTPEELRAEYALWQARYGGSRALSSEHKPGLCMVRMARIEAHARARGIDLEGDPHPGGASDNVGVRPGPSTPPRQVRGPIPEREEAS